MLAKDQSSKRGEGEELWLDRHSFSKNNELLIADRARLFPHERDFAEIRSAINDAPGKKERVPTGKLA